MRDEGWVKVRWHKGEGCGVRVRVSKGEGGCKGEGWA